VIGIEATDENPRLGLTCAQSSLKIKRHVCYSFEKATSSDTIGAVVHERQAANSEPAVDHEKHLVRGMGVLSFTSETIAKV
jgi:hypothetical protein